MEACAADILALLACRLCKPLSTMYNRSQTVTTHKHHVLDELMPGISTPTHVQRMMRTQSDMQLLWQPCIQYTMQHLVIERTDAHLDCCNIPTPDLDGMVTMRQMHTDFLSANHQIWLQSPA